MRQVRRSTLKAVAQAAGVSAATASNVLNGRSGDPARVSAATKERVRRAANALSYKRNEAASSMRTGKSHEICVVLGGWDSPWIQALMARTAHEAASNGLTALAVLTDNWFDYLLGRNPTGIIVALEGSEGSDHQDKLEQLAARGHHILFHGLHVEPQGFDVIRPDFRAAIADAMNMLTSRHHRIGIICNTRETFIHRVSPRIQGYVDGLARAGLHEDLALVGESRNSRTLAMDEALRLLEEPSPPTALFCTNDLAGIASIWAANKLGIKVPEELEIIGIGNTPEGAGMKPSLSTIGPPPEFQLMLQLLLARMNAEDDPAGELIHSSALLHERGTTSGSG